MWQTSHGEEKYILTPHEQVYTGADPGLFFFGVGRSKLFQT